MKYSLRSLMIIVLLAPPLLAGTWFFLGYAREFLTILTPVEWAVVVSVGTLIMLPLALGSWALVKLGPGGEDMGNVLTRRASVPLVFFTLFFVLGIPAFVAAILAILWWWPV